MWFGVENTALCGVWCVVQLHSGSLVVVCNVSHASFMCTVMQAMLLGLCMCVWVNKCVLLLVCGSGGGCE